MINILCGTENSLLEFLNVSGHAQGSKQNVVCSAVTCLTRTALEITTRLRGITINSSAPDPGIVKLEIVNIENDIQDKVSGITDFLLIGLIGIKRDFPEYVKLEINDKEWYDGSQKRWW